MGWARWAFLRCMKVVSLLHYLLDLLQRLVLVPVQPCDDPPVARPMVLCGVHLALGNYWQRHRGGDGDVNRRDRNRQSSSSRNSNSSGTLEARGELLLLLLLRRLHGGWWWWWSGAARRRRRRAGLAVGVKFQGFPKVQIQSNPVWLFRLLFARSSSRRSANRWFLSRARLEAADKQIWGQPKPPPVQPNKPHSNPDEDEKKRGIPQAGGDGRRSRELKSEGREIWRDWGAPPSARSGEGAFPGISWFSNKFGVRARKLQLGGVGWRILPPFCWSKNCEGREE